MRKTKVLAVLLSACVLAGCTASASPTATPSSATAEADFLGPPVALSVSPAHSVYQTAYESPDNPNWAFYAEITLTNQTDESVRVETVTLCPNHRFYGEAPSTPVQLPQDAVVELRDTSLWELNASRMTLESCPVVQEWAFGEDQLDFPFDLAPGESRTGTVYLPGGVDLTTALPTAEYLLDAETSVGHISYSGMAIAPSGNLWGLYTPTAGRVEDPITAQEFCAFLEDSQLLLWLDPDTLLADSGAETGVLPPTDELCRAASVLLTYLTDQGQVTPVVCQSGIAFYAQDVWETVLYELTGRAWDCSGLAQTVQADGEECSAVPLWYAATNVSYSLSIESQRSQTGMDLATPESADGALGEITVAPTYEFPAPSDPETGLTLPGARPWRIGFARNASWQYLPFCLAGIEQLT